jgi:hypothetical protein
MATTYKVLTGIDYAGKRAEPGDLVTDIPPRSVTWLVAQGIIEAASGNATTEPSPSKQRERKSPSKGDE